MSEAVSVVPTVYAEPASAEYEAALALLTSLEEKLHDYGFRKYRVDTYRFEKDQFFLKVVPPTDRQIRIGYSGGEWRFRVKFTPHHDQVYYTVKYDVHHPLPTVEQLLEAVLLPKPPHGLELDVNGEYLLRGAE